MAIWKPERRFLAVCKRCLGGAVLCVRVVVGGLYGNPMRFVGRVVLCAFLGNSLGFRAVGAFGVDYCTFRNLECAFFGGVRWGGLWIWGYLGCVRERWNFLGSFGVYGNLERSF